MLKISRSCTEWRTGLWHPKTEPRIRNWSHPVTRKTVVWHHHFPEETYLCPSRPVARPSSLQIQEPWECLSSLPWSSTTVSILWMVQQRQEKSGALTMATYMVSTKPNRGFRGLALCLCNGSQVFMMALNSQNEKGKAFFIFCSLFNPLPLMGVRCL